MTVNGETAERAIVVSAGAVRPAPVSQALLRVWTASRGGAVVAEAKLGELPAALAAAIRPQSRVETRHPMRSPWWLVPFTLALSAEWWLRRRRGLR